MKQEVKELLELLRKLSDEAQSKIKDLLNR